MHVLHVLRVLCTCHTNAQRSIVCSQQTVLAQCNSNVTRMLLKEAGMAMSLEC